MTTPDVVAQLREQYVRALPDGEHAAVAVFLAHDLARDSRFAAHVSPSGVDWDGVLAEGWSTSQRFLFRAAAALWGRQTDVEMSRVAYLNDDQYRLFKDMLDARMTGRLPSQTRP